MNNWSSGEEIVTERGPYLIKRVLGEGGFGVTYLAQSQDSNELVTIKTINNNSSIKTYAEDILIKEFTKLTRINNPYIIKAIFFDKIDNRWCLFLSYIRGKDLDKYVREKGALAEEDALKYIYQVGQALNYLHHETADKFIHRDIKPSNIMLSRDTDRVILIDFGTAKRFSNGNSEPSAITKIYTPGFSSPEQCRAKNIYHASDVYSLAATLYFLLTAETPIHALERLEEDILISPKQHNPEISEKVNSAILKGMALKVRDRSQSVEEWLNLLQIKKQPSKKSSRRPNYNLTKDIQYSFHTEAYNEGKTYYFTLDKNQEPIELGNGNYGSVYLAHDKDDKEYAIKILYEYDGSVNKDIIEQRFDAEITSSKNIRKALGSSNDIPGVVLTEAGTKKFKESPAFNTLKKHIAIERLSNYCLVMEKYEKTLEELLEQGIDQYAIQSSGIVRYDYLERKIFPSKLEANKRINQEVIERDRETLKNKIYELNGYDLLRCLNFEQRIANILPYLQDIAQGLNYLHKANYLHLDLKPANIFIKSYGQDVRCAIGDLGFLETSQLEPKSLLGKYDQLPLGTIHFRSPEQKQFRDVANVELANDYKRTLIIRDPKFRDTIIEKGDYVIFSKNKQKAYKIQTVEISKQKNAPVLITLELSNNDKTILRPSKQTQANFYKVQGKRTDLFGIGAVAFNLLTCGESPERFYESIHSNYDTEESDVDSLIKYYEKVYSFESNEPGVTKIFEPFRDQRSTEYAPIQIVELILKCMLYKTKKTFFNSSQMEEQEATDILLEQIIGLYKNDGHHRGQDAPFKIVRTDNLFYKGIVPPNPSEKEEKFIDSLEALKKLSIDKYDQRLKQGIWYFSQLTKLVKTHLENPADFYFAEIHPQNVVIRKPNSSDRSKTLDTNFVVYRRKKSYQNDLRSDLVFTKIMMRNDRGNPYVPKLFSNMHREITLEKVEAENSADNYNKYQFKYYFSDTYENKVNQNDWIVIKPINQSHNRLFKVIGVNPKSQTITLQSIPNPDISEPNLEPIFTSRASINNELKRCIYYKNINPCLYYLQMLGNYLYNIFFLGINNNDYELVQNIFNKIHNELYFLSLNEASVKFQFLLPDPKESVTNQGFWSRFLGDDNQQKEIDKLQEMLRILVLMYLKLSFSDSENSYYRSADNNDDRIFLVLDDIKKLQEKIADFLGINPAKLDYLIMDNKSEKSTLMANMVEAENSDINQIFPSFHTLVFSQVSLV